VSTIVATIMKNLVSCADRVFRATTAVDDARLKGQDHHLAMILYHIGLQLGPRGSTTARNESLRVALQRLSSCRLGSTQLSRVLGILPPVESQEVPNGLARAD
jgi:hypothetical protein